MINKLFNINDYLISMIVSTDINSFREPTY